MKSFDLILEHAETLAPELALAMSAAAAGGEVIAQGALALEAAAEQLTQTTNPDAGQPPRTQPPRTQQPRTQQPRTQQPRTQTLGVQVQIQAKGVGDLVSQIDLDADQAIGDVLRSGSDLPILSEELSSEQPTVDDMWIVDPLDASTAFLMRAGPEFPSVLIALRQAGETYVGVTYFPMTGDWFYAVRGKGAWRSATRLVCRPKRSLNESWVEMNQYGDALFESTYFANLRTRLRSAGGPSLVTCNVPNSGVAMRIAVGASALAAAVHDNNPARVKQAAWDIAAPQLILEEAGGVFLNPLGERTNPFVAEPIIVANSLEIAQKLLALVTQPAAELQRL